MSLSPEQHERLIKTIDRSFGPIQTPDQRKRAVRAAVRIAQHHLWMRDRGVDELVIFLGQLDSRIDGRHNENTYREFGNAVQRMFLENDDAFAGKIILINEMLTGCSYETVSRYLADLVQYFCCLAGARAYLRAIETGKHAGEAAEREESIRLERCLALIENYK